jgi:hypothetical protein
MKTSQLFITILVCVHLLSCQKKDSTNDKDGIPQILSINGKIDSVGKIISILGNNFSENAATNVIVFNGAQVPSQSAIKLSNGNTQLQVQIPTEAKTGPIRIKIGNKISSYSNDTLVILKKRIWKEMAQFIGPGRTDATSFTINNKGYIFGGRTMLGGGVQLRDLYQYNPELNSWKKMADFPDEIRQGAFALVIENKVYIGGGVVKYNSIDKVVYEFSPELNTWTRKADLPYAFNTSAYATLGSLGYVVDDTSSRLNVYDPKTNTWTTKSGKVYDSTTGNYPPSRSTAFVYNNLLYLGFGSKTYFNPYQLVIDRVTVYKPQTNEWGSSNNNSDNTFLFIYNDFTEIRSMDVISYGNTFYTTFGDVGTLLQYNKKTQLLEPYITKKLGIIYNASCFRIGSELYVTGGAPDYTTQGSTKLFMIDLSTQK